jgi:acetoin utilization deacetylase AcuC-like enzyme
MKVVTHEDFYTVYNNEPAAARGRIESVHNAIKNEVCFVLATPAERVHIEAVHSKLHTANVTRQGLYPIAALAAGGTIQAAVLGLSGPSFALVRPPGHHAYPDDAFGYCYFNNIAIALEYLKKNGLIATALVLDFDLHRGDGTEAILNNKGYAFIHNPSARERGDYLHQVGEILSSVHVDIIAVSAGFDNHLLDWGGLLATEDYQEIGRMIFKTCQQFGCGCFATLEGGYHNQILGESVLAFLRGLAGK